jgi:uncharacterized protein DUF6776
LKVVAHQPWRRPLFLAGSVLIGVVCLVIGYALGHNAILGEKITGVNTARELSETQEQLQQLDAQLIDLQLSEQVHREASNTLRNDLTVAHRKAARLQEELAFYKGLMAPSSLPRGLQIAELELTPVPDTNDYTYQLLLTQVALRRSFIAGEVRIDVVGAYTNQANTDEAVLSLTELTDMNAYPLKFRFRYFQDLTGRITLPEGFAPGRVLVTANQSGKDPLQVTFPWPTN